MSKIIGICPAAGKGTRLGNMPGSKELITIGFQTQADEFVYYPKAISQYLVEAMTQAGTENIFFVVGEGKYDLLKFYGDGHRFGVKIAYLFQEKLNGMPFAIDLAYDWNSEDTLTLFGMPDTLIEPRDAFTQLLAISQQHDDDVVLGLFKTDKPHKFGMVEMVERKVVRIIDKPVQASLEYLWGIAVWNYKFSSLMHKYLQQELKNGLTTEVILGDVFLQAIAKGLKVSGYAFENGRYFDIGTVDDLYRAMMYALETYPHPK